MQITDLAVFLDYLARVRERTMRVVRCVPPEQLEWAPRAGMFTLGDLARHIAAIERYMFVETVQNRPSRYHGCGPELAGGYTEVLAFMERLHQESVTILSGLKNEGLARKCLTPEGSGITVWKWLRAMVEHEIHHRGQIYQGLAILGVGTPPLYGLTSEQVRERSVQG